jgi:hypothetical protein
MIEKVAILSISIFLSSIAGLSLIYPIYLQFIMDRFSFSLSHINLYGLSIIIGGFTGFPIGFIYDYYGPKLSTLIGTFLLSIGYFLLHLLFTCDIFIGMPIHPLLILGFIIGQGNYLLHTTSLCTNFQNFKFKHNSTIVCLLITNIIISPSVLITYKSQLTELQIKNINIYISLFILLIGLSCFLIMKNLKKPYQEDKLLRKYQKYKEKHEIQYMVYYNMITIFIFIIGVFINYIQEDYVFPIIIIYPLLQILNFVFIICEYYGVFDTFFYPEFKKKMDHKIRQIELSHLPNTTNNQPNLHVSEHKEKNIDIFSVNSETEVPFIDAVFSKKFILLVIAIAFGIGSALSNINNINFILKSIVYETTHYSGMNKGVISIYKVNELFIYVILYFTSNTFVRISSYMLIHVYQKRNTFSHYFIIFSLLGLCSQILSITMNTTLLYLSIMLIGATHGAYMTFIPLYVKHEFGLINFGKVQGILLTGGSLGVMLISNGLFMCSYKHNTITKGGDECYGRKCFILSYVITSILFGINVGIGYTLKKTEDGAKEANKDFAEMLKKKNII